MSGLYQFTVIPLSKAVVRFAERYSDLEAHEINERLIGYCLYHAMELVDVPALVASLAVDLEDCPHADRFMPELERAMAAVGAQLESAGWDPYDVTDTLALGVPFYQYVAVDHWAYALLRDRELGLAAETSDLIKSSVATGHLCQVALLPLTVMEHFDWEDDVITHEIHAYLQGNDDALKSDEKDASEGFARMRNLLAPLRQLSSALPSALMTVTIIGTYYRVDITLDKEPT